LLRFIDELYFTFISFSDHVKKFMSLPLVIY
jgi:hypothetical protein